MNAILSIAKPALVRWVEDEVAIVRRLWGEGVSASLIARELPGRSRCAVVGKVHRLQLNGRRVVTRKKVEARVRVYVPRPKKPKPPKQPKPRAVRVAKPPPINMAWQPLPGTTPIDIMALTATTCRWPLGEMPFLYCGARVESECGPYCPEHTALGTWGNQT